MASSELSAKLSQLEAGTANQQRADEYSSVLESIIANGSNTENNLVAYVQSITSDNIGVIHSRPLLAAFVERFRDLEDNDLKINAG